jgi:hypothetical protein
LPPVVTQHPNLQGEDMTRKLSWRIGLAAVLAVSLAACGDEGGSPLAPRSVNATLTSDTVVTEFTVWPSGGRFTVGGTHRIVFPAAAICDLVTSGYGPRLWDAPCVPSVLPVRITAKSWVDAEGRPQVDFQPAMRFAPTLGDGVQLFLLDKKSALDPSAKILYCGGSNSGSGSNSSGSGGGSCVDESLNDASLVTRFDSPNGFVYRRIKHFSGYNVTAGRATVDVELSGEELAY